MGVQSKKKKKYVIKKKRINKHVKESKQNKENTKSIHNEIIGILTLSIGLLVFLGFYMDDLMGIFGSFIKNVLTGLLGIPSMFIPIFLIIFPILLIFKKDKSTLKRKSLYTFLLLVILSGILQSGIYKYSDFVNRSPIACIVKFYKDGNDYIGGGVLGGLISVPLLLLFQSLGTIVILTTASIIVIILITDISMFGLLKRISSLITNGFKSLINGIKEGIRKDTDDVDFTFNGNQLNSGNTPKSPEQNIVKNIKRKKKAKYFKLSDNDEIDLSQNEALNNKKDNVISFDFKKESEAIKDLDDIDEQDENNPKIDLLDNDLINDGLSDNDILDKTMVDIDSSEKNLNSDNHSIPTEEGRKETLYKYPPLSILNRSSNNDKNLSSYRNTAIEGAKKLEETLKSFGVEAKVVNVSMGPAVTRYELQPSPGVKVSRIVNLSDDIALNLASSGVRIEAPIPGKAAVGIEVPNKEVTPVLLREVLESKEFNSHTSKVAFTVGKDISGECIIADISKMPHMLIAGATGSGKSVCINSLIMSILYKSSPDEVKMLLIDPKVVELGVYNGIPHLLIPVVTDPKKAAGALSWAVQEMINRYKLFADRGVRDIKGYNEQVLDLDEQEKLPLIVIIIDELSDLMMAAPGDVEDAICRLAQMARAAGMHLVVATQRPSVDVITGLIKANIPSRISFAVSSQIDSRTILDMGGAEKLLGKGDMLFYPTGRAKPLRVQGAFVSDKEVEKTVEFIKAQDIHEYDATIIEEIDNTTSVKEDTFEIEDDELLPQAIEMVIEAGQASVSLVQRRFKVGYARAARMIDQMEARAIVGGFEGSKPRQVLVSRQQWEEMKMTSPV